MAKYLSVLILIFGISCTPGKSLIRENITIKIYLYEDKNEIKASAMPEIKAESVLMKYERRFYYLLMNIPEIHLPEKHNERNQINRLYPDTTEIKRLYLEKYAHDKKLAGYFEQTLAPIDNPNMVVNQTYSLEELMEVASKFFYCDEVMADTSVQAHVCVGLNGVKEASWEKDYTLLEAFCYEGIFHDLDNENSLVWDSFVARKKKSSELYKTNITTLNKYLQDVKLDLFERMKNDEVLKKQLLDYYEANKTNLAFRIGY